MAPPAAGGGDCWSPHAFTAGCISGAAGILVGHPLDTLKTFAQTGRSPPTNLLSLFRGIHLQCLMAGTIQSIHLGIYENIRRKLAPGVSDLETPLLAHACAGTIGGVLVSTITTPLSRVKVAQQLSGADFLATLRGIRSLRSMYAGGGCTLLFEASRGGYMVVYSLLKRSLAVVEAPAASKEGDARPRRGTATTLLPLWARVVAGGLANVVVWGVMFPVETVRNVQQAHAARDQAELQGGTTAAAATTTTTTTSGGQHPKAPQQAPRAPARHLGAATAVRSLLREGGVARLYRGYLLTILRAGPVAGIILPCFELVLPLLEGSSSSSPPPSSSSLRRSSSRRNSGIQRHTTM